MAQYDGALVNSELQDAIGKLSKENIVEVDIEVFRRKLLPLAVSRYSNIDVELDLRHWEATTGKPPYHGVRVMKNGKELFETPPLILTPRITLKGESIASSLQAARIEERNGMPKKDVLDSDVSTPVVEIPRSADAISTWVYIFKYFGVVLTIIGDDEMNEPNDTDLDQPTVGEDGDVEMDGGVFRGEQWDDDEDESEGCV